MQVKLQRNLDVAPETWLEEGELGGVEVEDHQLNEITVAASDASVGADERRLRELHAKSDLETIDGDVV
jgi:hypothetical protein